MTAKEMFKELGYEVNKNKFYLEYRKKGWEEEYINFYFEKREYVCGQYTIGIELHKAITQQMKELGWLE